uniref:Two pore calcium channel protein 1-like n=1 Tax=Phallusia mammillata TaxID=59560 RepID=A0A6F9DVW5_9ASCI|nr:two pore calcium channel protein 1-like [Phallusia mammillata]
MFILEILLKIYVYGPREYFSFHRLWNWFDFTIIMAAFIATIIEASLNELNSFPREVLDFIMVLRCLRLVRIAGNIEGFRIIIMTIVNIMPSLLTYGVVLLMLYYAFAIVGMEAFQDKIKFFPNPTEPDELYCGNEVLNESEFHRMGYCNNNFNDILHSFVTLVILTVVNQWHIITLGYTLVTSKAARLYFMMFHMIVVILIMNIIVAFVLEAFILEYGLCKTEIESQVEKTIHELGLDANENMSSTITDKNMLIDETDSGEASYSGKRNPAHDNGSKIKFRINEGHKNIEVLLQKMFEGEIKSDGTVPSSDKITLDGVIGTSVTI